MPETVGPLSSQTQLSGELLIGLAAEPATSEQSGARVVLLQFGKTLAQSTPAFLVQQPLPWGADRRDHVSVERNHSRATGAVDKHMAGNGKQPGPEVPAAKPRAELLAYLQPGFVQQIFWVVTTAARGQIGQQGRE